MAGTERKSDPAPGPLCCLWLPVVVRREGLASQPYVSRLWPFLRCSETVWDHSLWNVATPSAMSVVLWMIPATTWPFTERVCEAVRKRCSIAALDLTPNFLGQEDTQRFHTVPQALGCWDHRSQHKHLWHAGLRVIVVVHFNTSLTKIRFDLKIRS